MYEFSYPINLLWVITFAADDIDKIYDFKLLTPNPRHINTERIIREIDVETDTFGTNDSIDRIRLAHRTNNLLEIVDFICTSSTFVDRYRLIQEFHRCRSYRRGYSHCYCR